LILIKLERYEEAAQALDHAIGVNPDDIRVWYKPGHVLKKLGRNDEASEIFEEVDRLFSIITSFKT